MLTNVPKMLIEVDSPIYCLYATQSRLSLFPHIEYLFMYVLTHKCLGFASQHLVW